MKASSACRGMVGACLLFGALFTVETPLLAQASPMFDGANDYRNAKSGIRALVPKYWLTYDVTYVTLRGADVEYLRVYPRADKGSRISTALDVYVSSIDGIFNIPARLRGKLSDADLVNWYIDRLARSQNAFTVHSVRRDTVLGLPALTVDYSETTYDKYKKYTTVHFLFNGDRAYQIEEWFLSHRTESKAELTMLVKELRLLTQDEIRLGQ